VPIKEKMTKKPPRKNDDSRTKELESHKKKKTKEKLRQIASHYPKLLEYGLM
jgi:hypothetical protein